MPIASVVVEILPGASEFVLGRLGSIRALNVYGVKENQIVTVIESSAMDAIENILKEVQTIEQVVGVYPVYIGEHE